jgi:hypothetical protein
MVTSGYAVTACIQVTSGYAVTSLVGLGSRDAKKRNSVTLELSTQSWLSGLWRRPQSRDHSSSRDFELSEGSVVFRLGP